MACAKQLRPVDDAVRAQLAIALTKSGLGQACVGQAVDLSQNRVGIILRGETPPATIGEVCAITAVLGLSGWKIIRMAEEAVAAGEKASVTVGDGGVDVDAHRLDDDRLSVSCLAARRAASRLSWDASQVGADVGEEPQGEL